MYKLRQFSYGTKGVTACILGALFFDTLGLTFLGVLLPVRTADAAVVVVDSTASPTSRSHNFTGAQTVFVSDATGYIFYRDSNGQCVYSKSTDSGDSWGSSVVVDSQTDCIRIVVWYDQWTPGDTGSHIHIVTMDTGDDALFYNRLDTASDTLLLGGSPVNATVSSGQVSVFSVAINTMAITKGTDGDLYLVSNDDSDSYVVSCASSCGVGTNWLEIGPNPLDDRNDHNLLAPLAGGNILLINRDTSANVIRSKIWNGTAWSNMWDLIDPSAAESSEYDGGFSSTVDFATGFVYLAYATDNNDLNDNDDDIRTAVYDGSDWTSMFDVLTNEPGRGLVDVAIAIDQNNSNLYVAYTLQDTGGDSTTGNIYYKRSTDGMTSWGSEVGPINATAGDIKKPGLDPSNANRLYVSWWDSAVDDRFGETMVNIGPDTILSTQGSQIADVRSETTDAYLGGAFRLTSLTPNSVTAITINEAGTIDASLGLANTKLFYDLDTSLPYDCTSESYHGSESQFGATAATPFSAANGSTTFSGSVVGVSSVQTLCLYVVTDVTPAAADGATIELQITSPATDIAVSGSDVSPVSVIALPGTTTVVSPQLTQTNYHWRNDDGSESAATSATGGIENTPLTAVTIGSPKRLRFGVSVEGSTSTNPIAYQLEFAAAAPTCTDVTLWTAVDTAADAFDMSPSANVTDGADTTNISIASGGVSDTNSVFKTPNGAVQTVGDSTSPITLEINEFVELEYAVVATATALEGETYCFRLSNAGQSIGLYDQYARATINAQVSVAVLGSQIGTLTIPAIDTYIGGSFSINANEGVETITDITITESGTIDASLGLANTKLFYDLDTSLPYDCTSESYNGSESQFGATAASPFSAANGSTTFSGSVGISTANALCLYVITDITSQANNGETIEFAIASAKDDVLAGSASVSPSAPRELPGTTVLVGSEIRQTGYHWRNDNGSETTATSFTRGNEATAVREFPIDTPIRLRLGVSNNGAATSEPTVFQLEFAPQITTCDAIATWTAIDATMEDDWDMSASSFVTDNTNTTNIAIASGGVSDGNTSFRTPNSAVRTISGSSTPTTLTDQEFVEYEFALTTTIATSFDTTYCFRVIANGAPLDRYDSYPELTTASKRDFKTQRGNVTLTGTTQTLVAGVDYDAPSNSNTAFIRITNTNNTGAGDTDNGGSQDVEENTVYISNPDNLATSVTFARDNPLADTHVDWEIIEFIGQADTDNEVIVQSVGTVNMNSVQTTVVGPTVAVDNASDVVVFVTGVSGNDTANDFYSTQVTAAWDELASRPVFTRAASGDSTAAISYAVVEFTGMNWKVQRVEHTYTANGVIQTQPIAPVTSLAQTFIHAQKRVGAESSVASLGHEVFLSSIGVVSFQINSSADLLVPHVSVAWVVENIQTGVGAMRVERQSGDTQSGAEPLTISLAIADELDAVNNSSIFGNSAAAGTNNAHPRATAGLRITSPLTYELWRSDTGSRLFYRTEIVQWPVADLALRQNYYRVYVDNDMLTPTDPWPAGPADLGENTSVTAADDPPGIGEVLRVRMTYRATNANWPADFYRLKLQYAERVSTCTAVGTWSDLGAANSASVWRGFDPTGTIDGTVLSGDPPTPGDLLLSVADVAGNLVHQNLSASNTHIAFEGEDVEYDWYVQHNGALADTTYCFRTVEADGTALSGYLQYPQIRTAPFTPRITDWRWFDDAENETPSVATASLNTAPVEIAASSTLALRVVIDEEKSVNGQDVKFKLQFSQDITFANPIDVFATETCNNDSTWCYTEGGGTNNQIISTAILGTSDPCVGSIGVGCGTHNSSGDFVAGHQHPAASAQEYSFTVQSSLLRASAVYYFRLFDVARAEPVMLSAGASNPAAVAASANLVFTISGLPDGTNTAGITTDVQTTPSAVNFGVLPVGTDAIAAQRLDISTNATQGYQVWKYAGQQLTSGLGTTIANVAGSNLTPAGWNTVCLTSQTGCVGYHTTDATLSGGSARFAPVDTYAPLHTTVEEIMYSSLPADESHDVVYRVRVRPEQPAGDYTTNIVYIAAPVF